MDTNTTKFATTTVVWLATAAIFIFGFFRANISGIAVFLWFIIGLALVAAPAIATHAIWNAPIEPQRRESAGTLDQPREAKLS